MNRRHPTPGPSGLHIPNENIVTVALPLHKMLAEIMRGDIKTLKKEVKKPWMAKAAAILALELTVVGAISKYIVIVLIIWQEWVCKEKYESETEDEDSKDVQESDKGDTCMPEVKEELISETGIDGDEGAGENNKAMSDLVNVLERLTGVMSKRVDLLEEAMEVLRRELKDTEIEMERNQMGDLTGNKRARRM